jgi:hypothetical protein
LYQRNDSRPGEVKKFNEKWKGPYVVIDNSLKSTVKLKSLRAGSRERLRTFDASVRQIKLYHSDTNLPENHENESSGSESEPEIESEHEIESEPEIHSENEIESVHMLNPLSRNLSPSMPNISQTNTAFDGAPQIPLPKNLNDYMSTVVDPPSAELVELSQRVDKTPLFVLRGKNPPRDCRKPDRLIYNH